MSTISFRFLRREEAATILPQLFRILHTNMSLIAPSDCSYDEDRTLWLAYIIPALDQAEISILLMYAGDNLAGYFQYRIVGDTMAIDEVEIKPEYQRTMVFYRFCQFLLSQIPEEVKYLTSYVHKENRNSQSIHAALGMERIGENGSGTSWHYRGEREKAAARFQRRTGNFRIKG